MVAFWQICNKERREKDNSLYEDVPISNIDTNIPKLQSFGVTLFNEKKTMSERQWSVYKKMLQLDIPKAAKFWCQSEKDNVRQ